MNASLTTPNTIRRLAQSAVRSSGLMATALALCCGLVHTQTPAQSSEPASAYPGKPIRIIVPFAAGGPSDVMARVLARLPGLKQSQLASLLPAHWQPVPAQA